MRNLIGLSHFQTCPEQKTLTSLFFAIETENDALLNFFRPNVLCCP